MLVVITVAAPSAAPEPTLATVLQRAGAYVGMVERGVSGIVAEERYGQQWTVLPRGMSSPSEQRHRELVSDLLIVKLDGRRPPGCSSATSSTSMARRCGIATNG